MVPIPGTTSLVHLKESFGAAQMNLSAEDLENIKNIISSIHFEGDNDPSLEDIIGKITGTGYSTLTGQETDNRGMS